MVGRHGPHENIHYLCFGDPYRRINRFASLQSNLQAASDIWISTLQMPQAGKRSKDSSPPSENESDDSQVQTDRSAGKQVFFRPKQVVAKLIHWFLSIWFSLFQDTLSDTPYPEVHTYYPQYPEGPWSWNLGPCSVNNRADCVSHPVFYAIIFIVADPPSIKSPRRPSPCSCLPFGSSQQSSRLPHERHPQPKQHRRFLAPIEI